MPISKDQLVDVLRVRYDAYSAEAVFTNACAKAGLDGTTDFDTRSLATFRDALERVGDRVGGVLARIDAMLADGQPAAVAQPVAKPEVKADAKPEAKADAKPEVKVDAKPEPQVSPASVPSALEAARSATIVLAGIELEDGEELLVCGAHAAMGDWDPESAKPMMRAGDHWLVLVDLPDGAEVAFKFLRRDPDGEVTWEPGGNRTVRAMERLDATWREVS
jgi:hypothetical protein